MQRYLHIQALRFNNNKNWEQLDNTKITAFNSEGNNPQKKWFSVKTPK